MPQEDSKTIAAKLRKGELSNLYYIFGKDVVGVEKLTRRIIRTAVGENEDFALTKFDGKSLDMSSLEDTIQMMPMMSEYNCILINDYNCERPREEMHGQSAETYNKKLIGILKDIPPQTVIIFNVTGFEIKTKTEYRTGKTVITDKNMKLADFAAKNGTLCEMRIPTSGELAKMIAAKVSARGSAISLDTAQELAEMCLCDTMAVENEVDKLCSYSGSREITRETLALLVHRQSGVTIFNLADAVASFNRKAAFDALDELMSDKENRGAILANITNAFLDLYRAACAKRSGKQIQDVVSDFSYAWEFKVKNAFRDSSRMNIDRIRACIKILRDTAVQLNSTSSDEKIVLEEAVTKMLMTGQQRRQQ